VVSRLLGREAIQFFARAAISDRKIRIDLVKDVLGNEPVNLNRFAGEESWL
jgi:hypothetical protein